VQRKLIIEVDGIFGSGTTRAVKTFQGDKGLTADGVVGTLTWAELRKKQDN
jgi:peptidoglycan hydrolase-like protein with peptidoglycan-binding domain